MAMYNLFPASVMMNVIYKDVFKQDPLFSLKEIALSSFHQLLQHGSRTNIIR